MYGRIQQSIAKPFGSNVFGSAIIRVEPDVASIDFSVLRTEKHPKQAFQAVHKAATEVREYLTKARFDNVGSSRVTLNEKYNNTHPQEFIGYQAKVAFNVLLNELDRFEILLTGVVDAGVNQISRVEFQTTKLKEVRAEARQRAVAAAREKAQIYCEAAGVKLGSVIHIEDINPESDRFSGLHGGPTLPPPDDESPLQAFDPGSIIVRGAVMMSFEIQR